jgi:hypothetical protein
MTFPFRWHDLITPWVAVHKQIATTRLRLLKAKKPSAWRSQMWCAWTGARRKHRIDQVAERLRVQIRSKKRKPRHF